MSLYNSMQNVHQPMPRQRPMMSAPVDVSHPSDANAPASDVNAVSSRIAQQLYTRPGSMETPVTASSTPVVPQAQPVVGTNPRIMKQQGVVKPTMSDQQAVSNDIVKRYMMQRY